MMKLVPFDSKHRSQAPLIKRISPAYIHLGDCKDTRVAYRAFKSKISRKYMAIVIIDYQTRKTALDSAAATCSWSPPRHATRVGALSRSR